MYKEKHRLFVHLGRGLKENTNYMIEGSFYARMDVTEMKSGFVTQE